MDFFAGNNPEAATELTYSTPYELMVAVVLSAQCTDKRVNIITPGFFQKFPDFNALSKASKDDVLERIKTCSYPNSKAGYLTGIAQAVVSQYNGILPDSVDELQKLPGIGRKTANVIVSVAFDKPALAVDTHVFRVSARIGLSFNAKNPLETEKQLVKYIPENRLAIAHHWLILHGRYICQARKPKCTECGIREFCKYYEKQQLTARKQ